MDEPPRMTHLTKLLKESKLMSEMKYLASISGLRHGLSI